MPLVAGGAASIDEPVSDAHARARKINPAYTEGELVRVAGGRNQAEAELIQGLLLEEGVPSLIRRSAAFDVPDFLAAGQRDVLVPESGAKTARELLDHVERGGRHRDSSPASGYAPPHALRIAAAVTAGAVLAASLAWVLVAVSS